MKQSKHGENPEPDKIIVNGIKWEAYLPDSLKKTLKKKGDFFVFT